MSEDQEPMPPGREISICPCGRSHDTQETLHTLCALVETYAVTLMQKARDDEGRDRALSMAKRAGVLEVGSHSRIRAESMSYLAMGIECLLVMSADPMAQDLIAPDRLNLILRTANDALFKEGTFAAKSLDSINRILGQSMPAVQRLINGGLQTGSYPTETNSEGPPEIVTQIARAVAERFGRNAQIEPVDTRFVEDFLARSGVNVKADDSHAHAEPEEDPHPDEAEESGDPHAHLQMIDAQEDPGFLGIGLPDDEDESGDSKG